MELWEKLKQIVSTNKASGQMVIVGGLLVTAAEFISIKRLELHLPASDSAQVLNTMGLFFLFWGALALLFQSFSELDKD